MLLQHPDQLPAPQPRGAQRGGEAQVGREHPHGQAQGRGRVDVSVTFNQYSEGYGYLNEICM